jgi:hypothetical protein
MPNYFAFEWALEEHEEFACKIYLSMSQCDKSEVLKPMKSLKFSLGLAICFSIYLSQSAKSQILFSDNFDADHTANWTANSNFGSGTNSANFFFDYSTVGIPSAPGSGGTTLGLKLGANLLGLATPSLAGISVSPTGKSFTGDYTLSFSWWHNWLGAVTGGIGSSSGGSGSTQLSTFGILSSGTTPNLAGAVDGVFFGADGDGASALDYRAYSRDVQSGYTTASLPAQNVYAAGSQNNTASLYTTLFPGGNTAGAIQTGISLTQTGSTLPGTAGFQWNQVEITKTGSIVTWKVNGTLLDTMDISTVTNAFGGNNILFGMSDTSTGAGTPASLFQQLDFTLIDNVVVTQVPEPTAVVIAILGATGWYIARRRRD